MKKSLYLATALSFFAYTDGAQASFVDEGFEVISKVNYSNIKLLPQKLTESQIKDLRDHHTTSKGSRPLVVSDVQGFNATMPSRWNVWGGGSDKHLSSVLSLHQKDQYVVMNGMNGKLIGSYSDGGKIHFDVAMDVSILADPSDFVKSEKLAYMNVFDSPLGDKDFFNPENTSPYARENTFFKLASLLDGDFVRQTAKDPRINQNIKTLLLMIAQQEGENIYEMKDGERDLRGKELYAMYLSRHGFKPLSSDKEFLPKNLYLAIFKDLIERIFNNSGYATKNCPTDLQMNTQLMLSGADLSADDLSLLVMLKEITSKYELRKGRISSLKTPLFSKKPSDFFALKMQRESERMRPLLTSLSENDKNASLTSQNTTSLSNRDIAWLVVRWGAIDPLERHIVGLGTEFVGKILKEKVPFGNELTTGLVLFSNTLGRKSVADLCVDTLNGDVKKETLLGGISSENSLKALDKSAECLIGLLPFGGVGYAGTTAVVRLLGFESPVHLVFWKTGVEQTEDRILSASSSVIRTGVKAIVPGGSLLLGASDAAAWYLGEKSLTHAGYHYLSKGQK